MVRLMSSSAMNSLKNSLRLAMAMKYSLSELSCSLAMLNIIETWSMTIIGSADCSSDLSIPVGGHSWYLQSFSNPRYRG